MDVFNAAADSFGIAVAGSVEVTAATQNRSAQSADGTNTYGDVCKVDVYGETESPSCDYKVVGGVTSFAKNIGEVTSNVVLSGLSINTSSKSVPTITANGSKVQTGATSLRTYSLPSFSISARHRAQDIFSILDIKKGQSAASDSTDYGLSSANYSASCPITLGDPKGVVKSYDISGGALEASFSLNWFSETAPTIALTSAATAAGWIISSPESKNAPENGYTTYTFTARYPLVGTEVVSGS